MKICPSCGAYMDDAMSFCPSCGAAVTGTPIPVYDPYDHTAEYDAKDISDNKAYCMLVYLAGLFGVIIALLASADSPYIRFNVRQYVKIFVCQTLVIIIGAGLWFTLILPVAAGICSFIFSVLRIICFVRICKGQAREVPILCKVEVLH